MANAIDLRYVTNIKVGNDNAKQLWLEDDWIWPQPSDYSQVPFTIMSLSSENTFYLTFTTTLEESVTVNVYIDNNDVPTTVTVNANTTEELATIDKGHTIRLRVSDFTMYDDKYISITSSKKFNAFGELRTLYNDFDNFVEKIYNYAKLFANSYIVSAKNLYLPDINLNQGYYKYLFQNCEYLKDAPVLRAENKIINTSCYAYMFENCSSLINIPELKHNNANGAGHYQGMFRGCTSITNIPTNYLPATNVQNLDYANMFQGCTSLTNVPNLPATTLAQYCYYQMFYGCTSLTTVPVDLLPATTLADRCYREMFKSCKSLTNVPNLPATRATANCYNEMFNGCTSLTTVPADLLPATTLSSDCYNYMFYGCTSLENVPNLPATTLGNTCYAYMFYGCTSLTTVPVNLLPATTLTERCYTGMFRDCTSLTNAPELPATTLSQYCYQNMFYGCKSLTNAPSILPAMTLFRSCYQEMFYGTAIEIAPVLPALSFAAKYNCYNGMFRNCRQLKWVKALFTTPPSTSYTANWLNDLPNTSTQIFVKNENATWTDRNVHSIPANWTVQTCAPDDYSYPE